MVDGSPVSPSRGPLSEVSGRSKAYRVAHVEGTLRATRECLYTCRGDLGIPRVGNDRVLREKQGLAGNFGLGTHLYRIAAIPSAKSFAKLQRISGVT